MRQDTHERVSAEVSGGPPVMPPGAATDLGAALVNAARGGAGTTYVDRDGTAVRQSYAELYREAGRLLAGLRLAGLVPGDSVLLQFDDNRNLVTAFWACVLGGFVPTPTATAPVYDDNAVTRRLRHAWELLDRPLVLTDAGLAPRVGRLSGVWDVPGIRLAAIEDLAGTDDARAPQRYPARPEDPVIQLLTSGSTGVPKCVRHPHRSLVARTYATAAANDFGPDEVSLNWMPLDHVGGIVMYNVRDVLLGCEHVNARTDAFTADPLRWLDWIERFRATNTWAPNFAFALVNDRAEEIGRRRWDLSSMRNICNAGEAVVSRTAVRFLRLLRPHGLAPDVMRPCWGMSETASGVTYSRLSADDDRMGTHTVDPRSLAGTIVPVEPGSPGGATTLTEVGAPIPGVRLRIVDGSGAVLDEGQVGRLQVTGDTMMSGYHRNPAANRDAYTADGWFDTGDLAFLRDGRLTLTGRAKDMIIIRGANYLCHEIESVAAEVDGVLPAHVAACGEHDEATGTERLVVFCTLTESSPEARRRILHEVGTHLSRQLGVRPDLVVPVERADFPRTPNGKIERSRLLATLRAGNDDGWLSTPVWTAEPLDRTGAVARDGVWVVYADTTTAGLVDRLRATSAKRTVVRVVPGPGLARLDDGGYQVTPDNQDDHARLLAAVSAEHGEVAAVVHAWCVDRWPVPADRDALTEDLSRSAFSVRALLGALANSADALVLTAGAVRATESDEVDPVKATLRGLVRSAAAESAPHRVLLVDVSPGDADSLARAVLAELTATGEPSDLVAYRAGTRLVPRLRPLSTPDIAAEPPLRTGGLYVVTGGAGGIGRRLADHLSTVYSATVVRWGRSPDGSGAAGAYEMVNVADVAEVTAAIEALERRYGRGLDGVFHLAGADVRPYWSDLDGHTVARLDPAELARAYEAKVYGTMALGAALRDRPDTGLVLFSSVLGHFGAYAFGAYASANSFLAGFAEYHGGHLGRPVRCLDWSMWQDLGMNRDNPTLPAARRRGLRDIDPDHGLALLTAALARPETEIVVGVDATNPFIARHLDAPRPVDAPEPRAGATTPPTDEVEREVAGLWQAVLGQRAVAREDDFFDLGGTSLDVARLIDQINNRLSVRLSTHDIYENPTVEELARHVQEARSS
jgi:acyl-CoA synthetase (AMP-forming)/AMP-acid ligase II/acyl carrier protein/NADP-dependent 3-hydroxy acid dehydrogenase YdfG